MKLIRLFTASGLLFSALLAGCASGPQMDHHRGGAMAHGRSSSADAQSMCSMHKQMMAGKSPAEQRALIEEHMKSMTAEMRQHMQSMMEQCT